MSNPLAYANLTRSGYLPPSMYGPPIPMGAGGVGAIPGLGSFGAAPPLAPQFAGYAGGGLEPGLAGLAGQLTGAPTAEAAGGIGARLTGLLSGGGPLIPKGAMVRGAGYGLLGQIGSGLIDKSNIGGQNSNIEQGLQGFSQGAGVGAGLGLLGGPFAELSVPAGAAVGGVVGGTIGVLSNIFGGGGDKKDARESGEDVLANAIQQANIPHDMAGQIIDTYDTLLALSDGLEGDAKKQAEQAALDQAGQLVLQAMQQQQQAPAAASNTLALQQQAGQIFQPLADDIRQSTLAYANAMGGIRDQLPDEYRAIADATVARELNSSNKLADAYMAQAAITPIANQLTQYQQDFNSYAAQLFSQQMAQQSAGGLGGQQASIASLLQPTG